MIEIVDQLGRQSGIALWYLAIVGGSAWKMEACLTRFTRAHLAEVLPDTEGGAQCCCGGFPAPSPRRNCPRGVERRLVPPARRRPGRVAAPPHLRSAIGTPRSPPPLAAEQRCAAALAGRTTALAEFQQLLHVNQRYAVTREQQARAFTLAWPALRHCAHDPSGGT